MQIRNCLNFKFIKSLNEKNDGLKGYPLLQIEYNAVQTRCGQIKTWHWQVENYIIIDKTMIIGMTRFRSLFFAPWGHGTHECKTVQVH